MGGFWSGFWGPFFTFTGSIIVAIVAHFVAEDFRRFRDGAALASAIGGEFGSYAIAIQDLMKNVTWLAEQAEAGNAIRIADIELPHDLIYESAVPKLGLLGVKLPEKVALTYGRICAFRTLYTVIAGDKVKTDTAGLGRLYRQLLVKLTEAETEGRQTITMLRARANETFCHSLSRSWLRWRETCCRT